jgi:hypothetical protein
MGLPKCESEVAGSPNLSRTEFIVDGSSVLCEIRQSIVSPHAH